jgi:hypothetical protein
MQVGPQALGVDPLLGTFRAAKQAKPFAQPHLLTLGVIEACSAIQLDGPAGLVDQIVQLADAAIQLGILGG